MTEADHQRSALIAGSAAVEASAELLQFAMEGSAGAEAFSADVNPSLWLAEALKRTLEIEIEDLTPLQQPKYHEALAQLHHACGNFLIEVGH